MMFSYFDRVGALLWATALVFFVIILTSGVLHFVADLISLRHPVAATLLSVLGYVAEYYFTIAYLLVSYLIIQHPGKTWTALELCRKTISKRWLKVFATYAIGVLLTGLSAILIIPLIWTLPWLTCTLAVLYRKLFTYQ